ncbi:SHOCT domain-containing protein [Nocardioides sp.]|uniref:SHOCT domain-containing protein n=1 Tax=Nocardioides sp. TaxID=35761 RepID=UPI003D132608
MYFDEGHMSSGWGVAAMLVMMLLFVVVVGVAVVAAVLVVRGRPLPSHPHALSNTLVAEQVLAERLAHGEIDPAEYAARMDALTSTSKRR